ncbi:cilia- and flagella-associated protein 61-like [Ostrinia nubilalis]|uniref:cilia- and flagella-associated protein 61-like n=1 Tax=Ostrinia nubilalis TaxID=29057 RepID=UPI0030822B0F
MSLAGHMTPVRPRRAVPNISGNKELDKIFQDMAMPFALWVLERPLSCLPKVFVNNSIVVVGASRTGLAFLESLIMGPASQYLTFSNVTLVSEHGLPTVVECLKAADTCISHEGRYTDRYLKSVPFYYYVDVMSAVMVNIDRKMKCIQLKSGGVKFYDELVLTCGKQFQHPDYLHQSLELVKEVEKGKPCDRILMDNPEYQPDRVPAPPEMPDNLMLINSLFEANSCMRKLMRMISDAKDTKNCLSEENQVVVYGECVEAYNCLSALLELGLVPKMVAFVEPFPPEDSSALRVNCFNNETVDGRIQGNLERLGFRILRQCCLAGWRQVDARIEEIHLMAPLHAIRLPCFAFFYYGLKAIDINAFKAINESGLVYDGGLIVGPSFETNDPHIYGAGPCTRYSRRLYAARVPHHYYCSEDVGEALARIFLHKLDPFVMCDPGVDQPMTDLLPRYSSSLLAFRGSHASMSSATKINLGVTSRRWQPVMKFESPIVQFSTLPGPVYYLTVRKPGPVIPMEVQLSLPHQGHTLVTDKRGNYFRLQLNALHCVASVTCLSKRHFSPELLSQLYGKHEAFFNKLLARYKRHFSPELLSQLYGKHEAFFNKLLARYKMGEIDDLYEFFTQPWMAALYQETFSDLLRDINEQDVGTVYDLVKSRYSMAESKARSVVVTPQSTCATESACDMGYKDAKNLGTFRSVIDKFVARTSSAQIVHIQNTTDIPSECGQSEFVRSEAASFWKTVGGESIVIAHIARYLNRNSVTNPHYARPQHEHH